MNYITSTLKYFFNTTPGSEFSFYIPLIILAGILIIGSIVFSMVYSKKKKTDFAFKRLFKKLSSRFITIGIILLVLIALRYENIPYFSMRIWLYLLFLVFLYIIYKYIKTLKVDYPREKENVKTLISKSSKETPRYLPSKKKRK